MSQTNVQMLPGPVPAHDIEAEQSVLGAILVRPEVMNRAYDLIKPADFYRDAHSKIFQTMMDLYDEDNPIDLVTVSQRLKNREQLEGVGGAVFLAALSEQVGFATNAEYYARIVHDKALVRRLQERAQEIMLVCMRPKAQENVAGLVDWAEGEIYKVAESQVNLKTTAMGDLAITEQQYLERVFDSKASPSIKTGYDALDNIISGFYPSDLTIIAGRPGHGKTALGLCIALEVSRRNQIPVGFFSLEMKDSQLVQRAMSNIGNINGTRLRQVKLNGEEWSRLNAATNTLTELPIFIDDTRRASIMDIRARCRRLRSQGQLGLVIVDYLQLIRWDGPRMSREQEVANISGLLKKMAGDLDVPVIAMAQLHRGVESRPDKKPLLSDLRESGSIEQDADLVLMLYRDELYSESAEKGVCEVLVRKQRNGATGTAKLAFNSQYTRFSNLEQDQGGKWYD